MPPQGSWEERGGRVVRRLLFAKRCLERSFQRPASPKTFLYSLAWQARHANRVPQDHAAPHPFDPNVVPPVRGLLRWRGPLAVPGLVIPLVVNTVYRMSWWARPHILGERSEAIAPQLTDRDAPTPVIWVLLVIGVETALLHRAPDAVGGRLMLPVPPNAGSLFVPVQAAAAPCVPGFQIALGNGALHPAIASTYPTTPRFPVHPHYRGGFSDDHQPAEPLADHTGMLQ